MAKTERIAVATNAIDLIKTHAVRGIAISIEIEFGHLIPKWNLFSSPYTFACWSALQGVRHWANERNYVGGVSYFFESGHASQGEANRIMQKIFEEPELNQVYRYSSHEFSDKTKVLPLQCADLLAWQWFTQTKRIKRRMRGMRADLASLIKLDHLAAHYDEARIRAWVTATQYKKAMDWILGAV
jgi:hypothetical protein